MNAITYALQRITKSTIPKNILNLAYASRFAYDTVTNDTIESRIREEVIDGRVLLDMNIVNTTEITIPLNKCERLTGSDLYTAAYRIPKSLTQGKKVLYPLHVTAAAGVFASNVSAGLDGGSNSTGGMYVPSLNNFGSGSGLLDANRQLANSVNPVTIVSNAITYMIGENTVLIKDTVILPGTMHLRVHLEMDENLNDIQPPYFPDFYKLVLTALKADIYRKLILEQDTVFIHSGGELNRLRDEIETYREALETYEELLEDWYKAQLLNNDESWRRHYQLRTPGAQ